MGICSWCLSLSKKQRVSKSVCGKGFIAIIFTSLTLNSFAGELVEIGRLGSTVSTDSYYELVDVQSNKKIEQISNEQLDSLIERSKSNFSIDLFYPLSPADMTPGMMKEVRFDKELRLSPFAIVGTDGLSLDWLKFRSVKLAELKAPIFVIQAESVNDIELLRSQFPELKFVPASSDGIGKMLDVKTYPFLVTSKGVWQ